mgnify:FL=1
MYRKWGRVGTDIGGDKKEKFKSLQEAKGNFKFLYFDKTENKWSARKNFVKKPKKFFPIEVDYSAGDDEDDDDKTQQILEKAKELRKKRSNLDKRVQVSFSF